MLDFKIEKSGEISEIFLKHNLGSFKAAMGFMHELPYRRNDNKYDLMSVFRNACGTCSTKHAVLKVLADENDFKGLKLMLGIFKMNGRNTPQIIPELRQYGLDYLPEAHNYLRYQNSVIDITKPGFMLSADSGELLTEHEIQVSQITDYKIRFHKEYISNWLRNEKEISYSAEEIYRIREQCIQVLSIR